MNEQKVPKHNHPVTSLSELLATSLKQHFCRICLPLPNYQPPQPSNPDDQDTAVLMKIIFFNVPLWFGLDQL